MDIEPLMKGDRSVRKLHPGPLYAPFAREIYVRPAIHPDTAPLPYGEEIRDRIACFIEAHGPRARRKVRGFLFRINALVARRHAIVTAVGVGIIIGALGYLAFRIAIFMAVAA